MMILAPFLLVLPLRSAGGEIEALASIHAADLRAHIEFLASDELEGREAGTEAEKVAARYLATRIEAIGLKPGGDDGGWFQDFRQQNRTMRNVVGILEGADARLRSEAVVFGAHFDHVGRGEGPRGSAPPRGEIHNGADDNASGTAALLELAEAFSRAPARRTLVFAWFSGEEKGLFGSQHYVRSPAFPLKETVAMLNLDMIGRSREGYLFVGGVGTSPEWPPIVERASEPEGLHLETAEGGRAPSDNTPFYEKGIPVLFLFTNIHEDYHGPGDDAEKIDYAAEERIVRAAWRMGAEVANRDASLPFRESDSEGLPADFMTRMRDIMASRVKDPKMREQFRAQRAQARFGIEAGEPDPDGGLGIEEVTEGGAAARAGMKVGDVILAVGETRVEDLGSLARALGETRGEETTKVRVRRGGKEIVLDVALGAPASRPARGAARNP